MRYVALLRAINVGGRNPVGMGALRDCFERLGYASVRTYIQSGNVLFEAAATSSAKLTEAIEHALAARFGFAVPVVVLSAARLQAVVDRAPAEWARRADLRRNVAFLRPQLTARQALAHIAARDGVDVVTAGRSVLYLSTEMSALGRSRLTRLITTPIYRELTIRTYDTCRKMLASTA
jgi:uncharacterized protein (DUF1697 family)